MKLGRGLVLLFLIMTIAALAIGGIAVGVLYNTAVEEERLRLVELAQSQARLLEAIARFQKEYSDYPQGPDAGAIEQIRQAHEDFGGLGMTGEFTLGRHAGDSVEYILRHRNSDVEPPQPVAFATGLAEPMLRALSQESGSMIGLDYRGAKVLAAYEPVAVLDLGIVAKIDMSEIRAPFIRAAKFDRCNRTGSHCFGDFRVFCGE